ncbi:MAG TPA: glycosyltransferase [Tepidisphaeraceae bacterium]|jgi:glycosyltransferase involved in cell wall biosynthesis
MAPNDPNGGLVRFSVIVPTYNRPAQLSKCLQALATMDYPHQCFEVIVVDDGGNGDVNGVVDRLRAQLDVHLIRQRNAGPAAARNAGVVAAHYDFLAFTDDDCTPHADWLRQLSPPLIADAGAMVGGRCINALEDNLPAVASQTILDVVNQFFNPDPQDCTFFPSDNIAMSRERFTRLGGFDASFRWSEDRDFCDRWSAQGWKIVHAPLAKVDHAHVMGLWGFFKQHFGYGRGAWRFHQARAQRRTGKLRVEGSFYLACLRQPFHTQSIGRAIKLAMIMCVWQIANSAGFAYQAITSFRARRGSVEPATTRPASSPSPREAEATK